MTDKAKIVLLDVENSTSADYWRNKARDKKARLVIYKGGVCLDCRGVFPNCCFTFDHRDPFEKSFTISDWGHTFEECLIEVDKCDLVCANCHAIRTTGNPKIKAKRSKAMTGQKRSPETVAKMIKAMIGRAVSPETRAKISIALTGRKNGPPSEETKAKIRAAQVGIKRGPLTKETKAKMSIAKTGDKNHNFGKKHSAETRAKMSAAKRANAS